MAYIYTHIYTLFLPAYARTAPHTLAEKSRFYTLLEETRDRHPRAIPVILGDFIAKLGAQEAGETVFGPGTFPLPYGLDD